MQLYACTVGKYCDNTDTHRSSLYTAKQRTTALWRQLPLLLQYCQIQPYLNKVKVNH